MALITDLPASTSVASTDVFLKDTGSATQKITAEAMKGYIKASAGIYMPGAFATAQTYSLSSGYRGVLYVLDSSVAQDGEYFIGVTGAGIVNYVAVKDATGITISTATNELTLTPSSGTRYVIFITAAGTVSR